MIVVAAALGALGLVCILSRRTILGLLVGIHLMTLGLALVFVLGGAASGMFRQGQVFGLFITLGGITPMVLGFALSARLYYLKKNVDLSELRSLKH